MPIEIEATTPVASAIPLNAIPRGGFEPAVADLKGRHPEPLDERGVYSLHGSQLSTPQRLVKELNLPSSTSPFTDCGFAGRREDHKPCVVELLIAVARVGFEPTLTEV